jgi:hypothetical protein
MQPNDKLMVDGVHDMPANDKITDNASKIEIIDDESMTSKRKMENDLMKPPASLGSHDLAQFAELSGYRIERAKAQRWAMMEIKFLVYDDTDVKMNGYDSDDEEGELNHALRMSTDDQDETDDFAENSMIASTFPSSSSCSTHHNGTEKFSCRICSSYPEFPHKWKPRKFRLVKPRLDHPELFNEGSVKSVDVCMHYVAISYCWPPKEENPAPREYQVRDLDGSVRTNRALDDVLDRAVDFANSCGLRMIWIDQECLPQPTHASSEADREEQELGIQSMDIVYNRAMVTAGLLNVEIESQAQLTAIETLLHATREQREMMINQEFCDSMLDFLVATSRDRWYTRAWVVQEALCAGDKLVLAFRRRPGLQFPSKFRYGYKAEREDRPYHSLDDTPRGLDSELVCLHLPEFWMLIDDMKHLVARDFMTMGPQLVRQNNRPAYFSAHARDAIEAADALHPRIVRANTIQQHLKMYSAGHYGKRPTINAAGALTLLKHRQCYFDSDRLAIIANMCNYDFRLDTKAVSENCDSLSRAILALALNNGDLSLLVPEAYLPWNHIYADSAQTESQGSAVLYQDFIAESPRVDHCRVRNFINFRLQTMRLGSFTSAGLTLPAYLWSVDREVDYTPIQAKWADTWESLRCWKMIIDCKKNETTEEFRARHNALTQRFSQPGISAQAAREFRVSGQVAHSSVVWGGIDSTGVQLKRNIDAKRIKGTPKMRNIIAQVIFDILRYTLNVSEDARLAQGLANSIWQSVRIDQVPDSEAPLPDEVGDALFTHRDVLVQPFATLQLDETLDGYLAQLWFVDRIMDKGSLWCGRYTPSTTKGLDLSSPADPQSKDASTEISTTASPSSSKANPFRPTKPQSILAKQLQRQMVTGLLSATSEGSTRTDMLWPSLTLLDMMTNNYWSPDAERRREETLLSTFDVDGPCEIATPYNPEWEILPRPELRSMSVCWIVERKGGEVRGLERQEGGGVAYKGKGKERESATAAASRDEFGNVVEDGHLTQRSEHDAPCLDVLRKVKGLWEIMDLPRQEYIFS